MGRTVAWKLRLVLCALLVGATVSIGGSTAFAHAPGSDGGFNGKGCGAIYGVSKHGPIGVTAYRISCRLARQVARGSARGQTFERWRCTGKRTRFGHCHGRGIRRGAGVGWYAYH